MYRENIEAVIFDMDGVLIDSEPLWKQAEAEAFKTVGVHLTPDIWDEVTGLRQDEVIAHRHQRFPWEPPKFEELDVLITKNARKLILEEGKVMPGVIVAMEYFAQQGYKIAIASSSYQDIIDAVVEKLGLAKYIEFAYSAEFEPYGKPHPGVYITTAEKLGIARTKCLAIEDSFNGVLAAKAARMQCIAIPDADNRSDSRFCIADEVVESLEEVERLFAVG